MIREFKTAADGKKAYKLWLDEHFGNQDRRKKRFKGWADAKFKTEATYKSYDIEAIHARYESLIEQGLIY